MDDEPRVLEGLTLTLRRHSDVETFTRPADALVRLSAAPSVAVVISDMRMPGMTGAAFLTKALSVSPDTTRLLLTGHADLESALAAVNDAHVFRFLTKPCPPPALLAAVEAAVEQRRLVMAERVLLEQTLHGSIKALLDVLALASPVAFGRATRLRTQASALATALGTPSRWQVEVAAMLSRLGCISLPPEVTEKLHHRHPLTEAERQMVERAPTVTERLIAGIPRLERIREILKVSVKPFRALGTSAEPAAREVQRAAQVLRVVTDFDVLESQGDSTDMALGTLLGRDLYDPEVLEALANLRAVGARRTPIREVAVASLQVGMVTVEDVVSSTGLLIAARGYEITEGFVERTRNFQPGSVREPIRVVERAPHAA